MKKRISLFMVVMMLLTIITGCGSNQTSKTEALEFTTGTFEGVGNGLHGEIKVSVEVKDGIINGINIIEEKENEVLGKAAFEAIIKNVLGTNSTDVDVVTGSTYSSKGLLEAIDNALSEGDVKLAASKEMEVEKVETEQTYDVVVLGAGGAGMSAAIEAAKAGASVAIVEKAGVVGGNTVLSGSFNGAGTRFQKDLQIEDTPEVLFQDVMKGGDNLSNSDLAKLFADNAGKTVEWTVDELGLEIDTDFIAQFDVASYPRAHTSTLGTNVALVQALEKKCNELGVKIVFNTKATELITDENNKVIGAKGITNDNQEITFNSNKGVIIATGGFAANFDMVGEYCPEKSNYKITTNARTIQGDGINMAKSIGANLVGMEHIQTNPSGNPATGELMLFAGYGKLDGGFVVNKDGKRFVNDAARRDVQCKAFLEQEDGIIYYVWGSEVDSKRNNFEVNKDLFDYEASTGSLIKADTLKECADFFGVNYENLEATRKRYNEMVRKGVDEDFGRTSNLTVTEKGPFYMASLTPSVHHTMGGIEINTNAQVINIEGKIIEGLYAAGEVTGGIHGSNRLGGNAVTDALLFGRIAGQNIVK
ncbi:flavocytochrome c [Natronincola ferrireducens]|uniref:Urocanate reductase n=1 Tax=Natronincola ferrireducens TaxID=393762 RepID=A0A1G9GI28_9FIRM|nr:flavocytochrome c [Natronincola ferrireducens]SDL00349.1 urocanate reductase [Natronincola ferrireducens]